MEYVDAFVKEIPKTDLHLHLDGSLRIETLIDLAKSQSVKLPSYTEEGLRSLVFKPQYRDLGEYLQGFAYTTQVMQNPENLERISYELALDNLAEGVRYIEVRFAPQLHMNEHLDFHTVVQAVDLGLRRAQSEFNSKESVKKGEEPRFYYGIICCAMRMFTKDSSSYFAKFLSEHQNNTLKNHLGIAAYLLAKDLVNERSRFDIPLVGLDLAGQEHGYPAHDYKEAYDYIHKNFIRKTVHAGEAYGAESIFEALTDLHTDRIGHGLFLFDESRILSPEILDKKQYLKQLCAYIADRRATVEVCLTSNLQTNPALKSIKDHSLKEMLEAKLSLTLCTDNRLVSQTTVSNEYRLMLENFEVNSKVFKDIVLYGFKRNFFYGDYRKKREYIREVMNYYDKILEKHNGLQSQIA